MKLTRCHIINFGVLSDRHFEFSGGINTLLYENGYGKSTLAVFIKAMLYGLPSGKVSTKLEENDRKKYTPWQGGTFGGSLEFETENKSYRIERTFGQKESEDTFALYDLATNQESCDYTKSIGFELFGVDAEGYERSVYISERSIKGKRDKGGSILDKLHSMLEDADENESYDKAIEKLTKKKKEYRADRGEGGSINKLEREKADKESEKFELQSECAALEALERELAENSSAMQASEAELQIIKDAKKKAERQEIISRYRKLLVEREALVAKLSDLPNPDKLNENSIAALAEREREIAMLSAEINNIGFGREEADELVSLEQTFGNADGERIREMLESATDYERHHERLVEKCDELEMSNDYISLAQRFAKNTLEDSEIDRAFALSSDIDFCRAKIAVLEQTENEKREQLVRTPAKISPVRITGFALALAAVVISSLALAKLVPMTLLPISIVALLGSLAMTVLGKTRTVATHTGEASAPTPLELEREKLGALTEEAERFSSLYSLEGKFNRESISRLQISLTGWRDMQNKQKALRAELEALKESEKVFSDFVSELGYSKLLDEETACTAIEMILRDSERYKTLLALASKKRERSGSLDEKDNSLREAFAEILGKEYGLSHKAALEKVREIANTRAKTAEKVEGLSAELAEIVTAHPEVVENGAESEEISLRELDEQEKSAEEKWKALTNKKLELERRYQNLADTPERLDEASAEVERLKSEIAEAEGKYQALEKTIEFLTKAKENLSERYIGQMSESFKKYISSIKVGSAEEFIFDSNLGLKLLDGGQRRDTEYYSRGLRDIIGFCSRLALCDVLFEGEKPFLILDDPFATLDETRLECVSSLLCEIAKDRQVIYAVCHPSRNIDN